MSGQAGDTHHTRDDWRPLSVRAATADDAEMTVEAVLATDAPVSVLDPETWTAVDEVLRADGVQLPASLPLLDAHNRESVDAVLGAVRGMRREGSEIVGRLCFDKSDERAVRAYRKAAQGYLTDISVGYRVAKAERLRAGETRAVSGTPYTATADKAMSVVTEWSLREASILPIGADPRAKVRAEQTGRQAMGDEPRAASEPIQGAEAAPPAPAPAADKMREAVEAERKRISEIAQMAREAGLGDHEVAQRAISEDWTADRAGRELLRAMAARTKPAAPSVPFGSPTVLVHDRDAERGTPEEQIQGLGFGLRLRCGGGDLVKPPAHPVPGEPSARQYERAAERGSQYVGWSMAETCREALRLATGHRVSGDRAAVREFMRYARSAEVMRPLRDTDTRLRAAFSTVDLANVFTDTFGAQLVRTYEEAPSELLKLARAVDVSNFRVQERPRGGQLDHLDRLARGDKAKHGSMSDAMEQYYAYRFAKQYVFDEQDIIDDRLDLLQTVPRRMGIAAGRVVPDGLAYIFIYGETGGLAAGALFSSGNVNLGAGALTSSTLPVGIKAMMIQYETAEDGKKVNLNLMPRYLVAPPTLLFTARSLIQSSLIVATTTADTPMGNANVLQNICEIVTDARLENGVTDPITGVAGSGSAANWGLVADPATGHGIEVGYVSGTGRAPVVQSKILDDGSFGIAYTVKHDVGWKALDYRGLYWNSP